MTVTLMTFATGREKKSELRVLKIAHSRVRERSYNRAIATRGKARTRRLHVCIVDRMEYREFARWDENERVGEAGRKVIHV